MSRIGYTLAILASSVLASACTDSLTPEDTTTPPPGSTSGNESTTFDHDNDGISPWDLLDRTPAAAFGHGLGWTTWEHVSATFADQAPDGSVELAVTVRNTGPRPGREVVQVYVEPPEGTPRGERPVRVLGGFAVVDAQPGVSTTVRVPVAVQAFRTWDSGRGGWTVPAGTYRLRVGRSSRDLRLAVDVVQPARVPAPQ